MMKEGWVCLLRSPLRTHLPSLPLPPSLYASTDCRRSKVTLAECGMFSPAHLHDRVQKRQLVVQTWTSFPCTLYLRVQKNPVTLEKCPGPMNDNGGGLRKGRSVRIWQIDKKTSWQDSRRICSQGPHVLWPKKNHLCLDAYQTYP